MVNQERLRQLAKSNFEVPTDEERTYLRQRLGQDTQDIQKLDKNDRSEKRSELVKTIAMYKVALAPICTVPDDVLRMIFLACLETTRYPIMNSEEAPLLLTQISSGMRWLALTTHALWSAIHISLSNSTQFNSTSPSMEGLQEWLHHRSGVTPLRISVEDSHSRWSNNGVTHSAVVDILVGCCSRWRDISFKGFEGFDAFIPSHLLTEADVPLLHSFSLDISSSGQHEVQAGSWCTSTALSTKSLKRFRLQGYAGPLRIYPVRWSDLTHMIYDGTLAEEDDSNNVSVVDALKQMTSLTSLHIRVDTWFRSHVLNLDEIQLPALRILSFSEYPLHDEDLQLISQISAPDMEQLTLGSTMKLSVILRSLLRYPRLKILHLHGIEDSNVTALLKVLMTNLCPNLQYIRCDSTHTISLKTARRFFARDVEDGTDWNQRWKGIVLRVRCNTSEDLKAFKKLALRMKSNNILDSQASVLTRHSMSFWVKYLDTRMDVSRKEDWWCSILKDDL